MTDKTIAFSLSGLWPPFPKVLQREKHSPTLAISPVWLKSAAIIATGWQNTHSMTGIASAARVGIDRLSGGEYHHAASGVWRRDVA